MERSLRLPTTRWKLRRAIRVVNEIFGSLHLEKHPDKTFIGRIERGFDFLGYSFSRGPLQVARRTLQNHASQLHRLYERRKTTPAWAVWSGCLRGPLDALVPVWVGLVLLSEAGLLSATPPEQTQAQQTGT